jgi:3-phosphoshikimate 1-carboxyvinyltransferase
VDAGLAGTVMRFVPPVATLASGDVVVDGDPRARERPLRPLVDALRELGASVDAAGHGSLPLTVHGSGRLRGGSVAIDASGSSQLLSALLLVGARTDEGIGVRHVGGRLPSEPFVELTVAMLHERGVEVEAEDSAWRVQAGSIHPLDITVEPDLSSAAPFLAAALVTAGQVRVPDWPRSTLQAGAQSLAVFEAMGATATVEADGLAVRGTGAIQGVDVDLGDNPELVCVLAAVAALAEGPTRISGIGHLRGHESDRIAALTRELTALGAYVEPFEDGLTIRPRPLSGGTFHTYDDHRMVMAAAVLGLLVPNIDVENAATVSKTMPEFVTLWEQMLAGHTEEALH